LIELNFEKTLQGSNGKLLLQISEKIENRTFLTLFGESGSGKSTILNILAGISKPDKGEIIVDGQIWFSSKQKIDLPPQKRNIGFVFQDYSLFPNMSIEENLLYALGRGDKSDVEKILKITELSDLKNVKPKNLSGGQKQRVALARAVVRKPKLLLLDEPLSALDFVMRKKLQDELILIHKEFGVTTILVSHDISEIYKLATDILQIQNGKVIKRGSPSEIFGKSKNKGLKFIGEIVEILEDSYLILVGHEIIEIHNMQNSYSVGDQVTISTNTFLLGDCKISNI